MTNPRPSARQRIDYGWRVLRLQCQHAVDHLHGLVRVAFIHLDRAHQMQRVNVVRGDSKLFHNQASRTEAVTFLQE